MKIIPLPTRTRERLGLDVDYDRWVKREEFKRQATIVVLIGGIFLLGVALGIALMVM